MDLSEKLAKLEADLKSRQKVAVAFSGGVDSTFLLAVVKRVLGTDAIAFTAVSPTFTAEEQQRSRDIAKLLHIKQILVETDELADSSFTANTAEKCYFCKHCRFAAMTVWATAHGYAWIAEGSNCDDLHDYRPGMKALAEFAQVCSPLLAAGFTKADIRQLSHEWQLPTWNLPSAACLASRLAYGLKITPDRLRQVEAAERLVRRYVSGGQLRVRHHGSVARIEVEEAAFHCFLDSQVRNAVVSGLQELGFTFVTVDLAGYRTGSMNEALHNGDRDGGQ